MRLDAAARSEGTRFSHFQIDLLQRIDGVEQIVKCLQASRHIARNYGGEVWVESPTNVEAGTGSTFTVRLPMA